MDRIVAAVPRISNLFLDTPHYACESLSREVGCHVTLKIETLNPVRCFKGRGTEVAVSKLVERDGPRPVVCASAGNLGQALAYSGRARNVATTVVASARANSLKLEQIRDLGARVLLIDGDIELARCVARQMADSDGMFLLEDSEDLDTCEGAATIGLELLDDVTSFDTILVALGGGALATGVGFVCKERMPNVNVVCVQPVGAPAMTRSWREGRVIQTEQANTIADGVAGRFPIPEVLDDLLELADDALLVQDESIIRGMRLLFEHAGLVVEPSAALGIAALLENRSRFRNQRIATIICGSNVSHDDFRKWVP